MAKTCTEIGSARVATSAATSNNIVAGAMRHRTQSRVILLQKQYKRLQ